MKALQKIHRFYFECFYRYKKLSASYRYVEQLILLHKSNVFIFLNIFFHVSCLRTFILKDFEPCCINLTGLELLQLRSIE